MKPAVLSSLFCFHMRFTERTPCSVTFCSSLCSDNSRQFYAMVLCQLIWHYNVRRFPKSLHTLLPLVPVYSSSQCIPQCISQAYSSSVFLRCIFEVFFSNVFLKCISQLSISLSPLSRWREASGKAVAMHCVCCWRRLLTPPETLLPAQNSVIVFRVWLYECLLLTMFVHTLQNPEDAQKLKCTVSAWNSREDCSRDRGLVLLSSILLEVLWNVFLNSLLESL